jgi:hypothetical protein
MHKGAQIQKKACGQFRPEKSQENFKLCPQLLGGTASCPIIGQAHAQAAIQESMHMGTFTAIQASKLHASTHTHKLMRATETKLFCIKKP